MKCYGVGIRTTFSIFDHGVAMLTRKFNLRISVNSGVLFCVLAFTSGHVIGSGSSAAVRCGSLSSWKRSLSRKSRL